MHPAARTRHATLRMAAPAPGVRRAVGFAVPTGASRTAFGAARTALAGAHGSLAAVAYPAAAHLVSAWHRAVGRAMFVDLRLPSAASYRSVWAGGWQLFGCSGGSCVVCGLRL